MQPVSPSATREKKKGIADQLHAGRESKSETSMQPEDYSMV